MLRAALISSFWIMLSTSFAAADTCHMDAAVCTQTGNVTVGGVMLEKVCLAFTRVETCTREPRVAECGALDSAAISTEPLASGQCQLVSETCTRETAGLCDRVKRDYTCLNGPVDAAPAQLVERRFADFEERLESNCADVTGESCTFFSSQISQGGSTRNINEKHVTRSWWERTHSYTCDDRGYVNSCSPYETSPVCRQSAEPVCQSYDDGRCIYASYTYTCESDTSFEADCDSEALCEDGNCDGALDEPSTDYAEASAWLNFLDDMADKNQCDADATAPVEAEGVVVEDCSSNQLNGGQTTPEIFKGEFKSCLRGFNDCCAENIAGSCRAEEHMLAEKQRAGAAAYLGWSCNYVLGGCLTVNEYWCTYDTKFARVFQQEAHVQTGSQLKHPSANPCPALSIDELQSLDISAMDLSDIYGDLLSQTGTPVESFIVNQLENELGMFEGNVQNTLQ